MKQLNLAFLLIGVVSAASFVAPAHATSPDEYINSLQSDARKRSSETQGRWVQLNKMLLKLPAKLTVQIQSVRRNYEDANSSLSPDNPTASLDITANRLYALRQLRTNILAGRTSGTRAENAAIDEIERAYQQELVNGNTYQSLALAKSADMNSCFNRRGAAVVEELKNQNKARTYFLNWRDRFDMGAGESQKYYKYLGPQLETYFTTQDSSSRTSQLHTLENNLTTGIFVLRKFERTDVSRVQTNEKNLATLCPETPTELDRKANETISINDKLLERLAASKAATKDSKLLEQIEQNRKMLQADNVRLKGEIEARNKSADKKSTAH